MATLQEVCEARDAVRWRLTYQGKRGGNTEEVQAWAAPDKPYAADVERVAREFAWEPPGSFRFWAYKEGSISATPGTVRFTPKVEAGSTSPEVTASRELVKMAQEFRRFTTDVVGSWERLARDNLRAVAKLNADIAELREELAHEHDAWATVAEGALSIAEKDPKLVRDLAAGVASVFSRRKAVAGSEGPA